MFRKRYQALTFIAAFVAAVVLFGLFHQESLARLIACRSDPVVILSDGTIVDISADIDTMLWNVTEVHYTLHVPQGLRPILVVHTPTWLTSTETFAIFSDNDTNQYTSTTMVRTRGQNVEVNAHMLVDLGYGNANGLTGQALQIELKDVLLAH